MLEYKVHLKLNIPKSNSNIMGLPRERYSVIDCEYEFNQDIDKHGEICSKVKGGLIYVSISDTPSEDLFTWAFDKKKQYNGEITIMDMRGETREQIYFDEARCIDLEVGYKINQVPNTITKLTLYSESIHIGKSIFRSE